MGRLLADVTGRYQGEVNTRPAYLDIYRVAMYEVTRFSGSGTNLNIIEQWFLTCGPRQTQKWSVEHI